MSAVTADPPVVRRSGWRDPEMALPALLAVLGVICLVDGSLVEDNAATRGPIGSGATPVFVGGLLLLAAALIAVEVLRGRVGEAAGGEDVALDTAPDWKAFGLLVLVFIGNAVLIETVGWPITGALLFFGACTALGNRRPIRVAIVALIASFSSYFLFASGLGVNLPAGWLGGVL